jgi:serine/threonine protein kinase
LKHPHIVELREVFDTKKTFYMVMEFMSGGELFERIVSKSKYSEREASDVTKKIASALKFCHDKNVVHRDLKPENLLYTDHTEAADIKIADFGFAKLIASDKVMATACGTPGYVAPEVLNNEPYTSKVDTWSLGVIIYILLCGFPPFYDENNAALFQQVRFLFISDMSINQIHAITHTHNIYTLLFKQIHTHTSSNKYIHSPLSFFLFFSLSLSLNFFIYISYFADPYSFV